jgi:hypothetical protein
VAISLAHEGRCFENCQQSLAPRCSENEKADEDWCKLLGVFLFLADENLALRLGQESLLIESSRRIVTSQLSAYFASCLEDSGLWESLFELYIELRKARELVHSLRRNGLENKTQNILANLEHIQRGLDRWRRQHASGANGISCARSLYVKTDRCAGATSPLHYWLDIEYHYALMYSFAPALHALRTWNTSLEPSSQITDSNVRHYSQFAHQAKQASRDLLSIVVYSLEPLRLLELAPVRFWSYIIAASLHLLKVGQDELTLQSK